MSNNYYTTIRSEHSHPEIFEKYSSVFERYEYKNFTGEQEDFDEVWGCPPAYSHSIDKDYVTVNTDKRPPRVFLKIIDELKSTGERFLVEVLSDSEGDMVSSMYGPFCLYVFNGEKMMEIERSEFSKYFEGEIEFQEMLNKQGEKKEFII